MEWREEQGCAVCVGEIGEQFLISVVLMDGVRKCIWRDCIETILEKLEDKRLKKALGQNQEYD